MHNTHLPGHIAFIMDGNGRWAEQRGLSRLEGHHAGVEKIREIVRTLDRRGVRHVTVYAFSTENWSRPPDEVSGLLQLLEKIIGDEARELHKNGIRLRHLGRLEGLSTGLKQAIADVVEMTRHNSGMMLCFALNYGGRGEIVDAVRRLLAERVSPLDVDESLFRQYLYTSGLPDVDLVIRTGGEFRISNFLLWQAAYSEYYFTPALWPDFCEKELDKALKEYGQRQRRFGGLPGGEQPLCPRNSSRGPDGESLK